MKKRLILLLFVCFISHVYIHAQKDLDSKVFFQENEDVVVNSAVSTYDNGDIMVAKYNSSALLIKLDSTAEIEWTKKTAENGIEFRTILELKDSCFLVAGGFEDSNNGANWMLILKMDIYGDTIWKKVYSGNYTVMSSSITSDSGFLLSGVSSNSMYISKFSKSGDMIWKKRVSVPDWNSRSNSVRELTDKSIIATGKLFSNYDNSRIYMIKLSESGDVLWLKKYGEREGSGLDIIENSSGILMLCGIESSIVVMQSDMQGEPIWTKRYPNISYRTWYDSFESSKFCKTDQNTYYIASSSYDWFGNLIEIDSLGSVLDFWYIEVKSLNIIKNTDGDYLIYGNGPVYGVKDGQRYFEYQIGIVPGEYGNFDFGCAQQSVTPNAYIDTLTSEVLTWVDFDNFFVKHVSFGFEDIQLDYRYGCVGFIGAVNEVNQSNSLLVYPNPACSSFKIKSAYFENRNVAIIVTDVLGRKIIEVSSSSNTTVQINTMDWDRGVYLIVVSDDKKIVGTEKIVIE